jgi:hypothetical protein
MSTNTRMKASQFCRLFAKQDCNTPIDLMAYGFFQLGATPTATAAGQADGGGVPLTSSRSNALEVNADTGSTALGGDFYVSAIKGNLVHGTADTNSSEIAVLGSLNNNTATFGSGDKYAVRGHLDLWGITNLTGANVNVGAMSAYVENEAVPVVDSGNVLCGVQAYQVTYKPTVGDGVFPARGINPAVWIRASAAAASWQTGIYMPVNSVETAIRVGNWVAAGASGSAIPFAAAQNVYADGQLDLVAVFGESTSNLTSAYSAKAGRFRHIATGTSLTVAQETYGLIGQMCAKGATLTHLHSGLMGTFEGTGAAVVLNSSYSLGAHAAVIARVGGHANITATTPLAGFLAFNNASAAMGSGTNSAFAVSVASATYPWTYGVYIPGSSVSNGVMLGTTSVPVTLAATTNYAMSIATTASFATASEYDAVKINAVHTGAGAIPVALRVNLESNVKLGTWANAAYVSLDLKTAGGTSGLATALCSELTMGAGATEGTFGVYEAEINCPSSWTGTGPVSFLYFNIYGNTAANFDHYGYFFTLTGVSSGSDHMWYDTSSNAADEFLRVKTPSGDRYLILSDSTTFS